MKKLLSTLSIIGIFLGIVFVVFPPKAVYPIVITYAPGESLRQLSTKLHTAGVIRSKTVFESIVILAGGEKRIAAGDYFFERPIPVYAVAQQFIARQFNITRTRVTLPEGLTRVEMARIFSAEFENFNTEQFLAQTKEGYVFPDTYFFFPSADTDTIVRTVQRTFEAKTASLQEEAKEKGVSFEDAIIMASLIEKEARGKDDRYVISGILQNRLRQGMLLQVDAPFLFILGKGSAELTRADLAIDSPYNTYRYKELPPGAINNPGVASIRAALYPATTPYLFYLHDATGTIYYGRTYQEHLENIRKHLR